MRRTLCFKEKFLSSFRRGGGALAAESEAWEEIEKHFGLIYVPHPADGQVIEALYSMAEKDKPFLMVIVGIPGCGKTKLLKLLVSGLHSEYFPDKYRDKVEFVAEKFRFLDIERLGFPIETDKRRVWVTSKIDQFIMAKPKEAQEILKPIDDELNRGLKKGESVILCGNVGLLGNVESREDPSIRGIFNTIDTRGYSLGGAEFIRIPQDRRFLWTKEFGIDRDIAGLTSGHDGFRNYSLALIDLADRYLTRCIEEGNQACEDCIAPQYYRYIEKLRSFLKGAFAEKLHDLLQFMWLKHSDVYLTPRALNLFWGYALSALYEYVEKEGITDHVNIALIYHAIYQSRLPSIYEAKEYPLTEAKLHKLRGQDIEKPSIGKDDVTLLNPNERLRRRLIYLFEKDPEDFRANIAGGAFSEFVSKELGINLTRIVEKILEKERVGSLVEKTIVRNRTQFLFLAPKELVTVSKGIKVPLMILDNSVLDDVRVGHRIFEEIPDDYRYSTHREKILKMEIEGSKSGAYKKITPCLHLTILDYMVLRSLLLEAGWPDLKKYPSTGSKIDSFLRGIDGFSVTVIKHLMRGYLQKDIKTENPELRINVFSEADCGVDFRKGEMRIVYKGAELTIGGEEF